MNQFIGLALFVTIAGGLALHAGLELPWFVEWFGTLPGDVIVKKEGLLIYAPFTSSALISVVFSFIFALYQSDA